MNTLTRRQFLRASSIAAVGTIVAACTAAPTVAPAVESTPAATPAAAPTGGTIVFPWASWEIVVQLHQDHRVASLINGGLIDLAVDGSLLPNLAERWDVSPDGSVYTFYLRQGVKWHDGEDFDAEDVAFTVQYLVDPKNTWYTGTEGYWGQVKGSAAFKAGEADGIAGLEVVDNFTVRLTLEAPNAGWLSSVVKGTKILPQHIYKDIDVAELAEAHAPIWFEPRLHIGTGPFKWAEGEDEKFVRLERFDDYWRGKPLLDGVLFQNFGENDTVFLALQKGEADAMAVSGAFYQQALELPNVNVVVFDRPYIRGLSLNLMRPYFQDVRVRQAISHAIDRQLLCDTILAGLAEPWYSFIEYDQWLNASMPSYPYDLEKAKALLAEAAADGAWDPERELELSFYYPGNQDRDFMAALQQSFTAAGIKTQIVYYESAAATDKSNQADFDIMLGGWGLGPDPDSYRPSFACDDIAAGIFHSSLPETCAAMDELFAQGAAQTDFAARKAIYDELQQIYGEQALYVPLFRFRTAMAINKRVGGFGVNSQTYFGSTNKFTNHEAEKWFITAS